MDFQGTNFRPMRRAKGIGRGASSVEMSGDRQILIGGRLRAGKSGQRAAAGRNSDFDNLLGIRDHKRAIVTILSPAFSSQLPNFRQTAGCRPVSRPVAGAETVPAHKGEKTTTTALVFAVASPAVTGHHGRACGGTARLNLIENKKMKKFLVTIVSLGWAVAQSSAQTLIAGWDFQTTSNGGTAAVASATGTPSPLVYLANFGSGTLYLDGTNGSSAWTTGVSNPQVTSFGGTTLNTAGTSFSTSTSGAAALALANSSANGQFIVFSFSMAGHTDLSISYATQRTATGFSAQTWDYSLDGSTWVTFDTITDIPTSFAVVTLSTISALAGDSSVFVRASFDGATAAAGNNRIDNIQFNAVPEPTSTAMLVGGVGSMVWMFRRRRMA